MVHSLPERSLCRAGQLDVLQAVSMQEVQVVDLRERGTVGHTGLSVGSVKVAVALDGVSPGAQVGVDGVSTAVCVGLL